MIEWQPVETAPMEQRILAWGPEVDVCLAMHTNGAWHDLEGSLLEDDALTHWMPLPGSLESPFHPNHLRADLQTSKRARR
jgi:hypothetical protein